VRMNRIIITKPAKMSKSLAGKVREAAQRAAREYCPMFKVVRFTPCYSCRLSKGEIDCQGNTIGTKELMTARARNSVLELPEQQQK